jgi:uncharacterized protein YqhQ
LGKQTLLLRIAYRVAIIPLIAGLSYEILKLSAKNMDKIFIKWVVMPGLWFQKLTTKEPDEAQIEVAIKALKGVLPEPEQDQNIKSEVKNNV